MIRSRKHVAALLTMNAALLLAGAAEAQTATGWQAQDFGTGGLANSKLYTPAKVADNPAVLVVIHMCGGNSGSVKGWFDQYADKYGFYMIAPQAKAKCFDSSIERGGEPAAIVSMVNWVVTNKHADKTRVFAAGMSSGGCMTNTLLAAYPDVFVGGSAMPGYPAGGWQPGDTNCNTCSASSMPPSTDGKYWGDKARAVFQWSGTYPCSQQWVGGSDEYGFQNWLPAVAAQWQNLASLDAGATATTTWSGWTRKVYKDTAGNVRLQTNLGPGGSSGQKHDIETVNPPVYGDVISFLSLDTTNGICGIVPSGSGGMGAGGMGAGGAPGSGGMSSSAGHPGNGGAPGAGGTMGMGMGGRASGTGGTTSTGGTTMTGTGGTTSTGGSSTATGGTTTTGTGGTSTGTGGSTSATGGTSTGAKGGSTSTGGASGSSGAPATPGSGGSDSEPPKDSGGCSLSVAEQSTQAPIAGLLVAGLAFFARRRRARR